MDGGEEVEAGSSLERTAFVGVFLAATATLVFVTTVRDADFFVNPAPPAFERSRAAARPAPKPDFAHQLPAEAPSRCDDYQTLDPRECSREQAAAAETRYAARYVRWGYYQEPAPTPGALPRKTAFVYSRNAVSFGNGDPTDLGRAQLSIVQGAGALRVSVSVERILHPGRLRCERYCPVTVLFGRGPQLTFSATANETSIDVVDASQFLSLTRGAGKVAVTLPLEGVGDIPFEFDVSGLVM
ncbi:MAG TPA: hypothetical protein VJM11_16095 [Nevskiaceae bacterium]|nr:hypothetical protein [Nevskiaceae bacterium]